MSGNVRIFETKLISYDFIDFKNEIAEGKIFKCVFECNILKRYTMYYKNLEEFLDGVDGMTDDKKLMELLEKKKKGMISEENLKKDLFKLIKLGGSNGNN